MHVTKPLDLPLLQDQLTAAAVPHRGLMTTGSIATGDYDLKTFDPEGAPAELPVAAQPVVDAHVAPPRLVEHVETVRVSAISRTTDATPLEMFRFRCAERRLYTSNLTMLGVDAGNAVSKSLEGRFTWKRTTGNAVMVGITVVSDIHDAAAAGWGANAVASGTDIVFTVTGALGRTIDWLLAGDVAGYAPAGI